MAEHQSHNDAFADAPRIYGVLGEFSSAEALINAARQVREAGYVYTDAYSPLPIRGLSEALGFHHTRLPLGASSPCVPTLNATHYTAPIPAPQTRR